MFRCRILPNRAGTRRKVFAYSPPAVHTAPARAGNPAAEPLEKSNRSARTGEAPSAFWCRNRSCAASPQTARKQGGKFSHIPTPRAYRARPRRTPAAQPHEKSKRAAHGKSSVDFLVQEPFLRRFSPTAREQGGKFSHIPSAHPAPARAGNPAAEPLEKSNRSARTGEAPSAFWCRNRSCAASFQTAREQGEKFLHIPARHASTA